jgi:flavin reductase (DIM6/NTAB) family NADH-FMN oxidoreductase RutF
VDDFTQAVAAMDGAMAVVTVADAEERDGCLVGFHSQASIDPPRYAVWLSTSNRTFRIARGADHLGVHVLGRHQHSLAELFGGETGDEVDKLAQVEWQPGPGGAPELDECPVRFVGRIIERHETDGDHVCFVLEPVRAGSASPWPPLRLSDADDIEAGHSA